YSRAHRTWIICLSAPLIRGGRLLPAALMRSRRRKRSWMRSVPAMRPPAPPRPGWGPHPRPSFNRVVCFTSSLFQLSICLLRTLSMSDFHRIKRLPPYVFEELNRLKASARAGGADIVDLGMGNPDLPTPQAIVDKLCEVVQDPRTHRYSSSKGIPGLRRAQAAYYACRCGVKLNPETQ